MFDEEAAPPELVEMWAVEEGIELDTKPPPTANSRSSDSWSKMTVALEFELTI